MGLEEIRFDAGQATDSFDGDVFQAQSRLIAEQATAAIVTHYLQYSLAMTRRIVDGDVFTFLSGGAENVWKRDAHEQLFIRPQDLAGLIRDVKGALDY